GAAQDAAAIARGADRPDLPGEPVAPGMMPRHPHRLGIDIAGYDPAVQPSGGGDRENAAAGADIERPAETPAPREPLQCQQTAARRWVLAGAEGGGRVDLDRDRRGRYRSVPMRAVDEKTTDALRLKGAAVLHEPRWLGAGAP